MLLRVRGGFSAATYNEVMQEFTDQNIFLKGNAVQHPANPVGFQQVSTYKASLLSIHRMQQARKEVPDEIFFDKTIWTSHHYCLMEMIKGQKQVVSEA